MVGPTHTIFESLDASWCLDECKKIVKDFPMTESSNSSGKFYHTYKCWHFHKSSNVPIIKKFSESIMMHKTKFEEVYNKELNIDFIVLAYTSDNSEEMSVWHKDRHFMDGQFHISVQGNGNIDVNDNEKVFNVSVPNGTLWYLNATHYFHKICPGTGIERFELCAPVNMRPEHRDWKLKAVSNDEWRHISGENPEYTNFRKHIAQGVKEAVARGTASNTSVAYAVNPD
jgi:hypothetical protein